MTTAATALTPDDLLQMGSAGKGYELVNGELKEIEVSAESSFIAGEICTLLKNHCKARQPGWVFPEGTGFRCFPDDVGRVRKPDTCYIALPRYAVDRFRSEGFVTVVPDLIVEVVSPNDIAREVEEKRLEWLDAGVREVWIVYPESRSVYVHRAGGGYALLRAADPITTPLLPEFSVTVAEFFVVPGEVPPLQ
jgi:Uma2 family endonuclease